VPIVRVHIATKTHRPLPRTGGHASCGSRPADHAKRCGSRPADHAKRVQAASLDVACQCSATEGYQNETRLVLVVVEAATLFVPAVVFTLFVFAANTRFVPVTTVAGTSPDDPRDETRLVLVVVEAATVFVPAVVFTLFVFAANTLFVPVTTVAGNCPGGPRDDSSQTQAVPISLVPPGKRQEAAIVARHAWRRENREDQRIVRCACRAPFLFARGMPHHTHATQTRSRTRRTPDMNRPAHTHTCCAGTLDAY
jgi:hypothetical protein